jgi:2-iminobutanoate/2-iminopropanoate deaminase
MPREVFTTDAIAPAVGPFSSAVRAGEFVYVSGQVGRSREGALVDGGVAEQTAQVLANLRAVLDAAGMTFDNVIRVGVYLTDMRDFAAMNEVFARAFREPYPVRTTIGVAALPLGARVEMDVIAR